MKSTDPRILRTRKGLQDTSAALLKAEGWPGLTVNRICQEGRFSRSTFYDHYQKPWEPLMDYLALDFSSAFPAVASGEGRLDPQTLLLDGKPLTWYFFSHVHQHRDIYLELMRDEGSQCWSRLFNTLLRTSKSLHRSLREISSQNTDPDLIASYLAGALLGTCHRWLRMETPPKPIKMAYLFSAMAAPGLLQLQGLSDLL
jgi:hypothetical protein